VVPDFGPAWAAAYDKAKKKVRITSQLICRGESSLLLVESLAARH